MLEIWYVALASMYFFTKFVQIVARVQNGPAPEDPGFEPKKKIENIKKTSSSEPLGSDA